MARVGLRGSSGPITKLLHRPAIHSGESPFISQKRKDAPWMVGNRENRIRRRRRITYILLFSLSLQRSLSAKLYILAYPGRPCVCASEASRLPAASSASPRPSPMEDQTSGLIKITRRWRQSPTSPAHSLCPFVFYHTWRSNPIRSMPFHIGPPLTLHPTGEHGVGKGTWHFIGPGPILR